MMTHSTFIFTSDYNAGMHRHIDDLYTTAKLNDTLRQDRLQASDDLVEAYVAHTGRRPDGMALGRLATYLLRDEILDPHPDKVTREEFPILSDRQLLERRKREVSEKLAQDIASDGLDYRPRTRDGNRKYRELLGLYN